MTGLAARVPATRPGATPLRDPFAAILVPAFLHTDQRPACEGHDPELWFDGDNDEAKHICRTCPLQRGCGEYGFLQREWGVWAGYGSGSYRLNKSLIRLPVTCGHPERKHYAEGMCSFCYRDAHREMAS